MTLWFAYVMPAGTPDAITRRLNTRDVRHPDRARHAVEAMRKQAFEPEPGPPEAVTARIRDRDRDVARAGRQDRHQAGIAARMLLSVSLSCAGLTRPLAGEHCAIQALRHGRDIGVRGSSLRRLSPAMTAVPFGLLRKTVHSLERPRHARRPRSTPPSSATFSATKPCGTSGRTATASRSISTSRPALARAQAQAEDHPAGGLRRDPQARHGRSIRHRQSSRRKPSASAIRCCRWWRSLSSSARAGSANGATGARPPRTSPTPRPSCRSASRST